MWEQLKKIVRHIRSHVLPGFIHRMNVLFGFHPECCDARAPVVLHWVLIIEAGRTLVGRGPHRLHALDHTRRGVEESVARISGLQALWRSHEPWYCVHGCGTGDGRGQPWIEGHRVGNGTNAGRHLGSIKGQHGRIVELHGGIVHLFLTSPLGPSVLEPHLMQEK